MHQELETFIGQTFRPNVFGGQLDKEHKTLFQITGGKENKTRKAAYLSVNAICFGPRKDNVLVNLEHVIHKEDSILIFYYEDMHLRWSYVQTNTESYFLFKKNDLEEYKIRPNILYIRGCYVAPEDDYWSLLGDFFNFVALWEGAVLCPPSKQMPNESKLFQINNSLRKAAAGHPSMSLGQSYVIKGSAQFFALKQDQSYVVKSLSGVRSVVVDENDYQLWPVDGLNHVPVLFQKKVEGNDLRVHLIQGQLFAKRSHTKEKIDYRYDANFFQLSDLENLDEALVHFCLSVAREEDNQLLGIDFIQTDLGYVALEANPSPGWSAYHPFNGIDDEPFIIELLRVLKSAAI